eukprot:37222-Eustigmatos_ZCMA.PRE.1
MTKKTNVDIPTMTRKLYKDFYGGGDRRPVSGVDPRDVKASDLFMYADEEDARRLLNGIIQKKWTVVDDKSRLFKIHDSPHNYNVQ